MGEYNIEQHIKSSLENHPTQLNKELLWKNIQEKQKATVWKKVISIFLLSVSLIAFSALIIPQLKNSKKYTSENSALTQTDSQNSENNLNSLVKKNSATSTHLKEKEFDSDFQDSQISSTEIEKVIAQKTESNFKNRTEKNQKEKITFKTNLRLEKDRSKENTSSNISSKIAEPTIFQDFKSNIELSIPNEKRFKETSLLKSRDLSMADSYGSTFAPQGLNTYNSKLSFESLVSKNTLGIEDYQRKINKALPKIEKCVVKNKKIIECYDPKKKRNSISIIAYGIADYNFNTTNTSIENINYLEQRDSTTSYQLSNRAGIQLKYLFRNGLYFKAGIEQGNLRANFYNKTRTTTTEILPNQLIDIDIDMNGDTTKTYGNAPVTTIKTTTWDINNNLRTYDLPLLIGFQTRGGPLKYAIELGASINLNQDFNGWLMGTNNQPFDASNGAGTPFYKNKVGPSLLAGFNISYNLSPLWSVYASSNLKKGLDNLNSANNLIEETGMQMGLGIGVEYKLGQ